MGDVELSEMSLSRFREYCQENDDNIVDKWDVKKFRIECSNCSSKDTFITFRDKETSMGSEYTGAWTSTQARILVKCKPCGNAMAMEYI